MNESFRWWLVGAAACVLFVAVAVAVIRAVGEGETVVETGGKKLEPVQALAWFLVLGGSCLAGFMILFFDTGVTAPGGGRFTNLGLAQDRLLGAGVGLFLVLIGTLLLLLRKKE